MPASAQPSRTRGVGYKKRSMSCAAPRVAAAPAVSRAAPAGSELHARVGAADIDAVGAIAARIARRQEIAGRHSKVPPNLRGPPRHRSHDKVGRPDGMSAIKTSFIPHAEFHELPHSGHYGFAEQPDAGLDRP